MAYILSGSFSIAWAGDGAGPMGAVPSAQVLTVSNLNNANGGYVQVPGGDAPTTGNVSTAATTLATNLAAALNAQIGTIDGWASGNP